MDHLGLMWSLVPLCFYPPEKRVGACVYVCVCMCVYVCVCVCDLAFKGAPPLAHVSMCVCVLLSLCVVTPHERPPTDL